jgi:hypothetical protein
LRLIEQRKQLRKAMAGFSSVAIAEKQIEVFLHQTDLRWVPLLDNSGRSSEPAMILASVVPDRCPRRHRFYDVFDLGKDLLFEENRLGLQVAIIPPYGFLGYLSLGG